MRHLANFVFCLALLLTEFLGVPAVLAAQSASEVPRIRSSTHLVQIGVIVRDTKGSVENLTKDDFVVLDRGKQRKISIFSTEATKAASRAERTLPENTYSNLPQYEASRPKSMTIVLLDNLNTLSGSSPQPYEDAPPWVEDHALANGKRHLLEFLEQMDAQDRIAIYGLTDSLHVLCDFTCDREQLLAAVGRYDPTSKTQRESVEPSNYHTPVPGRFNEIMDTDVRHLAALKNEDRARLTMAALSAIAAHVADTPGRKNLLWLTANLPFSGRSVARILSPANIAAYPVDSRELLPRGSSLVSENGEMGGLAGNALGLDHSAAQGDQPIGIEVMEEMAEDTGGRAFVNTNDLTSAMRSAVEDSAVTYMLGFYVDSDSVDGKFHEVKVRVLRSGLIVRAPKGYFALKDEPANQAERHSSFLEAIRSPLSSSSIPLEVKVDRVVQQAHTLQITGVVGIKALSLPTAGELRKGAVDIYAIEQDAAGKVLQQANWRLNLELTEQEYQTYLRSGVFFHESVESKDGATVLRILVQGPGTGAVGSVIIPLAQVN